MAAINKEKQARINYTDEFLEKGGTLAELLRNETFQKLVEKNEKNLRFELVCKIADVLEIPIDELRKKDEQ